MAPSPTPPLWGWTPATRLWLALAGGLGALALIALGGGDASRRPAAPAPRLVVDPNTAPPAVLAALPHLGPAMVKRIVAARENAPLQSLDDLDSRVRGVGPATLASLRPFLQFARSATKARSDLTVSQRSPTPASAARAIHLARRP
jgi:competence protein ComEA